MKKVCEGLEALPTEGRLLRLRGETVQLVRRVKDDTEAPLAALERAGGDRALVEPARRAWTALEKLGRMETSSLGSQAPLVYDDLETALRDWSRAATAVAGDACTLDAEDAVDGLRAGQYRQQALASTAVMAKTLRRLFRRDLLSPDAGRAIEDAIFTFDHSFDSLDLVAIPRVVRSDHAAVLKELRGIRQTMRAMRDVARARDAAGLQAVRRKLEARSARYDELLRRIQRRLERGAVRSGGQPA